MKGIFQIVKVGLIYSKHQFFSRDDQFAIPCAVLSIQWLLLNSDKVGFEGCGQASISEDLSVESNPLRIYDVAGIHEQIDALAVGKPPHCFHSIKGVGIQAHLRGQSFRRGILLLESSVKGVVTIQGSECRLL